MSVISVVSLAFSIASLVGLYWLMTENAYEPGYEAGYEAACGRMTTAVVSRYEAGECEVLADGIWYRAAITEVSVTPFPPPPPRKKP